MARIRSIHPGLFTDEAFVSLSMTARVLYVGILTESDDRGVFEWKAVRLKIRLMPVDNVEVPSLLDEMVECNSVKRFSSDGKSYGLVRNFCRYQRPKKPKYVFPLPPEFYTYAGLKADGSLPALHQIGTTSEKSPQREDGGGEMEEESGNQEIERGPPPDLSCAQLKKSEAIPMTLDFRLSKEDIAVSSDLGMTDSAVKSELTKFIAHNMQNGAKRVDWSAAWVLWCQRWKERPASASKGRTTAADQHSPTDQTWDRAVKLFAMSASKWSGQLGPEPGMGGCRCPPEILRRNGIDPATGLKRTELA